MSYLVPFGVVSDLEKKHLETYASGSYNNLKNTYALAHRHRGLEQLKWEPMPKQSQ